MSYRAWRRRSRANEFRTLATAASTDGLGMRFVSVWNDAAVGMRGLLSFLKDLIDALEHARKLRLVAFLGGDALLAFALRIVRQRDGGEQDRLRINRVSPGR